MSINWGVFACCQGEVKQPPMRIWRKPLLVSKLVQHSGGVNMLCSSNTAQPPPPHEDTPPPPIIPKHPPSLSKLSKPAELQWSLALNSVQWRSRRAHETLRLPASNPAVLAGHSEITACHLEPILKPSQSCSIQSHWPQLSVFFCSVFYALFPLPLELAASCSKVWP